MVEQEQEVKRVGYMRELAENYMEAVEEVVRDTQIEVSKSHPVQQEALAPQWMTSIERST